MLSRERRVGIGFLLLFLAVFQFNGNAQVFDIVVDKEGTGDYTTIQEALDAVPDNQSARTLIFVKNGTYKEKVTSSSTKKSVSIIGESSENVILTWNDYYPNISAADSYTFLADIAGLYMENISIENTASKEFSGVGQALAVRTIGDSMAFKNCKFYGFQDTYYAHKNRNYNLNCYVEGGTDFIYGDATSVWDSCTIKCLKGGSFITAPSDAKILTPTTPPFLHGLLFRYCDVIAEDGVPDNQYYLGRPWNKESSSVFVECTLGAHIKPVGWSTWEGDNHESTVFAEYKSTKPDGSLVDISSRADWSYQLDSTTVAKRYNLTFFLRRFKLPNQDYWDPLRVTTALEAPTNVKRNVGSLTWTEIANAKGYIVFEGDNLLGFAETATFPISWDVDEEADYTVKSVSENGALSESSSGVITSATDIKEKVLGIWVNSGNLEFSENVEFQIYNMQGKYMKNGVGTFTSINDFTKGVYIIKASNQKGINSIEKIKF